MLTFQLLGQVGLSRGGTAHPVRGTAQRILLTALLVSQEDAVPARSLQAELWGTSRPLSSTNALQAHISRLRKLLQRAEPEREEGRLLADRSGYRLVVRDEQVDARAFVTTVRALLQDAPDMSPASVADSLRGQLAQWRGPVFGGVVGGPLCEAGARELGRVRDDALSLLYDAELRRGRHAQVLAELHPLVSSYSPYLGRFTECLMLALYRSGRQVKALEVFQQTATCLAAHGESVSVGLRDLHQAILTQAPHLDYQPGELTDSVLQAAGATR